MAPQLRQHLHVFELPPHPDYADGYILLRRRYPRQTASRQYGAGKVFTSEYDIKWKLAPDYARKKGEVYSKGVEPRATVNIHGREELTVRLQKKGDPTDEVTMTYSHLVACALLKTNRDRRGRKTRPHYIDPRDHKEYEADHWPIADQCDCRLRNLVLRHVDEHRSCERMGWPGKTLPASERGLKRPAAALEARRRKLKRAARKKPAAALRPGVSR